MLPVCPSPPISVMPALPVNNSVRVPRTPVPPEPLETLPITAPEPRNYLLDKVRQDLCLSLEELASVLTAIDCQRRS